MWTFSFFEDILDIVARYWTIHVTIGGMEQDFTCHIIEYFLEACPLLLAEFTKELWWKGTAFSAAQVKEDENPVLGILLFLFIEPLLFLLCVLSIRRAGGTRRRLLVFTTVGPLALTFVCNGSGSTVVHEEKKMIKKKRVGCSLMLQGNKPVALSSPSVFSCAPEHAPPIPPPLSLEHLDQWLLSPLAAEYTTIAKTSGLEYTMLPRDTDGCCALGSHPLLLGQQELAAGGGGYEKIRIQWCRPTACHAYCSCLKRLLFFA